MNIMNSEKNDIMRNMNISTIASTPYIGGILANILDKTVPEQVNLRYTSFIKSLESDIKLIKKELDYSRFETPQFYSIFVKVIHEIICNHLEEKRVVYKNILINTVDSSWNCNKNDFFFNMTVRLSADALNYLLLIFLDIPKTSGEETSFSLGSLITQFKFQKDYLISIITELVRYRLISGLELTDLGKQYCNFIFSPILPHQIDTSNQ